MMEKFKLTSNDDDISNREKLVAFENEIIRVLEEFSHSNNKYVVAINCLNLILYNLYIAGKEEILPKIHFHIEEMWDEFQKKMVGKNES